jgi:drug/metabolite transporter (DMT)-like permease
LVQTPSVPRTRSWGTTDLLMLGTVLIWGINFTVVKLALRFFSPMGFNALRFGLATITTLLLLRLSERANGDNRWFAVERGDVVKVILLGLIGHTLYQVLFINGLARTTPANSSLLMATSPIWVAVLSHFLRIERASPLTWAGIGVSFSGIVLLIMGGGGVSLGAATFVGDLMLLGCAIIWATYTTGSKPLLTRYSPLKLTALTMTAGTVPLVLLGIPALRVQDWSVVTPGSWGALLFSGLLAVAAGYVAWYTSVQRVGNARTAIYSNLTPVIAILFSWAVMGSTLAPLQVAGAAVVLGGLILTRRGRTG